MILKVQTVKVTVFNDEHDTEMNTVKRWIYRFSLTAPCYADISQLQKTLMMKWWEGLYDEYTLLGWTRYGTECCWIQTQIETLPYPPLGCIHNLRL